MIIYLYNPYNDMFSKENTVKMFKTTEARRHFHLKANEQLDGHIQREITKVKTNIENILYQLTPTTSYQELHITVDDLCGLNCTLELFDALVNKILTYLETEYSNLTNFKQAHFLDKLNDLWASYCKKCKLMRNIFLCLEMRVRKINQKFSLWDVFMVRFFDMIVAREVGRRKIRYVLKLIELERMGVEIEKRVIKEVVDILRVLGAYKEFLEDDFLVETKKYYLKKREEVLRESTIVEYFKFIENNILLEENRVRDYLEDHSRQKILSILYSVLLEENIEVITGKLDEAGIFEEHNLGVISSVYNHLIVVANGCNMFSKIFGNYLMRKGGVLMTNADAKSVIPDLLDFKDRVDEMITGCFKASRTFEDTVRTCFKKFINDKKYKYVIAPCLAKFIDSKMRTKLISEELLDKVLMLFRYTQEKDVFEAFYKQCLAKRLLLGKSSSVDAEKYMISKFKLECGDMFTTKLEGMFRDIDLNTELNRSFKNKLQYLQNSLDFKVHVLTSGFWPKFIEHKVTLPDVFSQHQQSFEDFYKSKHSGRNLQWISGLSSCVTKAYFKNGNKELKASLYQTLVLLQFNTKTYITYRHFKNCLNLNDAELKSTLATLVFRKNKFLTKNPECRQILDDDVFCINEDFQSSLFKITINHGQYRCIDQKLTVTDNEVKRDRNLEVDAALVRLMKRHKQLRHADLIAKIYETLKTPINPVDVKRRIETLIDREFFVRDDQDINLYHYVA